MARQPIQIEVILFRYINGSYEYLLLKRISSRGGFWQPVTGGLEEGEQLHHAALREVEEETGITNTIRIIDNIHLFILEEDPNVKEYVFGAEIDPNSKIVLDKNIYEEHDDHRWCSFEEAMTLLKWPGNKEALKKLNKILTPT